jgi:hypothetical protein
LHFDAGTYPHASPKNLLFLGMALGRKTELDPGKGKGKGKGVEMLTEILLYLFLCVAFESLVPNKSSLSP